MKHVLKFLIVLLLFSCSPEDNKVDKCEHQHANPEISMKKEIDGLMVFQGDILLPYDHFKQVNKAVGYTNINKLWPNGNIPYVIADDVVYPERVLAAIKHWEENTVIRLPKRIDEEHYVVFRNGTGCSSGLGYSSTKEGPSYINISEFCSTGNIIHEIGHTAGLYHEQSRLDRDEYITILTVNIREGYLHNFNKVQEYPGIWDTKDVTPTLDFGSIMMYGPYAFSSNGQPTITKKNGGVYSVQRNGLSQDDIAGIDVMYDFVNRIEDIDEDGIPDAEDNCPAIPNTDQADKDNDGIGDVCDDTDNRPDCDNNGTPDIEEKDCDNDGTPDNCESDFDNDGIPNDCDVEECDGLDNDGDGQVDEGFDQDNDGIVDCEDNCDKYNPNQYDCNADGIGDTCETDTDGDDIPDHCDTEECNGYTEN